MGSDIVDRLRKHLTGNAFDLACPTLLLALVARHCWRAPGTFVNIRGDSRISSDHLGQVRTAIDRALHPLPRLVPNPETRGLLAFRCEDVGFEDAQPWPAIKAQVAP